jgi:GNAT superfamily N-acetyltransferase
MPEQVEARTLNADSGEVTGLVTWRVDDESAEIVTIDAFVSGGGIGRRLLALAEEELQAQGVRRVTVVALEGAVHALTFYIKCGYRHHMVHTGAIDAARKHKFVPELNNEGTPLHDMWGFEKMLDQ